MNEKRSCCSIGEAQQGKEKEPIERGGAETPGSSEQSQTEEVALRVCKKCGVNLEITKFYKNSKTLSGYGYTCRKCDNAKKLANQSQKCSNDPEYKKDLAARKRAYSKAAYYRDLGKARARRRLKLAVYAGEIIPKPCEVCGAKAHAHHDDYSKPLDVVWLCRTHHAERHIELGTYKARKVYERLAHK